MSERLRILHLLEQGKINADEAARLLEALAHGDKKSKKAKFKIWNSLEGLPEIISTAIQTSTEDNGSKETLQFSQKSHIEFKGISGDLEIIGEARDTVEIQKDGFAKIHEHDKVLKIKALSGDIKIMTNPKIDLAIKGISGDVKINNTEGLINIESVSGDITGKQLTGSLSAHIVSGDLDLDYISVKEIEIESRSGDITLNLDEKIQAQIMIQTEDGDIDCDFELVDEEESNQSLKGIINKAEGMIKIKCKSGDVSIKKQKHK